MKFLLFKINFLTKTRKAINQKSNSLQDFFLNFKYYFIKNEIPINKLPNLHLLPDPSWVEPLKKLGISQNKLCITGNPFWDRLFDISKKYVPKKYSKNDISILIVTDALVEHGMWSENKFKLFITDLINELSKKSQFSFSFKIHPASENKEKYQNVSLMRTLI